MLIIVGFNDSFSRVTYVSFVHSVQQTECTNRTDGYTIISLRVTWRETVSFDLNDRKTRLSKVHTGYLGDANNRCQLTRARAQCQKKEKNTAKFLCSRS